MKEITQSQYLRFIEMAAESIYVNSRILGGYTKLWKDTSGRDCPIPQAVLKEMVAAYEKVLDALEEHYGVETLKAAEEIMRESGVDDYTLMLFNKETGEVTKKVKGGEVGEEKLDALGKEFDAFFSSSKKKGDGLVN